MRLTFLGTGSAWPIPRLGCRCVQCTSADPRDVRSRSAVIVEARPGGPAVLIDAGPDIYRQLCRIGKERVHAIEALVVTHVHPDHYLGLVDLGAALGRSVPLYHLADNEKAILATFGYLIPRGLELREMRYGEPFQVADVRLTPFDTHHFHEFSTAGIEAAAGGARLAYAPDFLRTEHDLRGLDLLAIDGSVIERESSGHQAIRGGLALARAHALSRVLFTHIGHVRTTHAEIEALVRRDGGEGFGVASDGLEVEVGRAPR